mgnify:CR=1 FL=1
MLGVPLNIEQFDAKKFNGSHILDVCTSCGTYGMGGPGFFGLKLQGDYGTRWLTYCIWSAGEHILFDQKVLECHPKYSEQYKPLISFDDYSNGLEKFKELLTHMKIENILALRGDRPQDSELALPDDYHYASELIEDIKSIISACVAARLR